MLYLHCGWLRTGTTSLQAALDRHRLALASAGISYPDEWRTRPEPHYELSRLLRGSTESADGLAALERFLSRADRHVLMSTEMLSLWLTPNRKRQALLRLLSAAQQVTQMRCVWTLRRLDELLASMYPWLLARDAQLPLPLEYFQSALVPSELFEGMREVTEGVGWETSCVNYERSGAHDHLLLAALGVPGDLREAIGLELRNGSRLNGRPSWKQTVALLHRDSLAERAGFAVDSAALRGAFEAGFEFEGDRPCELVPAGVRRELHERALEAAQRAGFAPYIEFFEDDEVPESGPVTPLELDALTAGDLDQLIAYLKIRVVALSQ